VPQVGYWVRTENLWDDFLISEIEPETSRIRSVCANPYTRPYVVLQPNQSQLPSQPTKWRRIPVMWALYLPLADQRVANGCHGAMTDLTCPSMSSSLGNSCTTASSQCCHVTDTLFHVMIMMSYFGHFLLHNDWPPRQSHRKQWPFTEISCDLCYGI
jgi:hypothetical protein